MRQNKPVHPPFKESSDPHHGTAHNARTNSGQALIEYVLILVLVAIAFGFALAATGPVLGNVFSNSVRDLLRQTEVGYIPDREEFWETVTYAFLNPPRERPQQTNTPAPPTSQPTAGPSPTPSSTFTATPETPTPIDSPTPTPTDVLHEAPWRDTIDEVEWYRTDPNLFLHKGLDPFAANWKTEFFGNTGLTGAPTYTYSGLPSFPLITFNGAPFYTGGPTTNFSLRSTRQVSLEKAGSLRFTVKADDGVKVFLNGTRVNMFDVGGNPIDTWKLHSQPTLYTGYATATAGTNTVVVEYYQAAGNPAVLNVNVQAAGPNVDDQGLAGSAYACNWGQPEVKTNDYYNNANTEDNFFEEYADGSIPVKSRCYLELRGSVAIPENWTSAELSFWDVWDFTGSGLRGWLEVAEYVPKTETAPPNNVSLDRDAVNWQRIDLRDGVSANYNWTHNKINLGNHINFNALGPERRITFRFVIENDSNTTPRRRWYIDDIIINQRQPRTITVDKKWTLDDLSNKWGANNSIYNEFIFTGGTANTNVVSGWQLVGNNKYGTAGQSFHDSVGALDDTSGVAGGGTNGGAYTDYKRHTESLDTTNKNDARAHSLEIDGYIDLTNIPAVDSDGNPGPPILAFYQGYDVGNGVGMEVQYTVDSYDTPARNVNWVTFPSGKIRDLTSVAPGDGRNKRTAMQEQIISLQALPGNPARIRVRWVMYVTWKTIARFDGWWIDQIRLGREEAPKWADYPFYDDAQSLTLNYWRFIGQWGPTEETGYQNHDEPLGDTNYIRRSWSSSPGGTYSNNETTWMEQRYPIDLYNDTPNKLWADPVKQAAGSNNNTGNAAVKPELYFYHSRDLAASDNFLVQWRRLDENETQWKPLWVYNHSMATDHTADNIRTAQQFAWEPVYIDLYPVKKAIDDANNAANRRDDDIVIRFVLQADGSGNAKGLRIDDVQIREQDTTTWKLWPPNENRGGKGNGNGVFYLTEADGNSSGRGWWDEWSAGGYWFPATFEKSSGALAFHDSSGSSLNPNQNQQKPPDGIDGAGYGEPQFYTPIDTFNVLQLNTIIDLREANGRLEEPTMYFWWRHDMGRNSRMLVQVSSEITGTPAAIDAAMPARCKNLAVVQCYEQVRGWTKWQTVPNFPNIDKANPGLVPSDSHWYAWTRAQVDLRPYAFDSATNTPGKRIRVRFVLDNLDATSTWDGWYIDNVYFEYRNPPESFVEIATSTFDDRSRNMNNWVAEGSWGLAPDVYQGGGGGPVNIGLWDVTWWTCSACDTANGSGNLLNQTPANRPVPAYSSKPYYQGRGAKPTAPTDTIAYNFGNGTPVTGWNVTDKIAAEFDLDTGIVGASGFSPGNRSFLVLSDDGVRMKVKELNPTTGVELPVGGAEWNLINKWKTSSPTSDAAAFNFEAGKRYKITLQYFESYGGAVVIMSIGDGRYSFTDSPKLSSTGKDIPPIAYGNSSLITKTVLDMTTMTANQYVLMEYHTMYKVYQDATLRVEVSNNGGFDWVQDGLKSHVYINGTQKIIDQSAFSNTTISNSVNTGTWQIRQHTLTTYRGQKVLLRFRMDRQLTWCVRRHSSGTAQANACRLSTSPTAGGGTEYDSMFYDGWWITPVIVEAIQ